MKLLKIICFNVFCLTLIQTISPQNSNQSFNKYRALLNSGERVEIEKGLLTDTALVNYSNNKPKEILLSDIRALDRRAGSHAIKGLLIGGGIGLLSSLYAVLEIQADPNRKLKDNAGEIFAGITVGCAAVGLLVGSLYDDWESVPLKTKLNADFYNGNYQLSLKIIF
jgi:hypothetical protein